MFRPNPGEFAEQIAAALRDPIRLNLHAQAHARSILIELGTQRHEWPNFTADLDRRLYASANHLLAGGIDLIESEPHRALARDALTRGAEALEYLVAQPQDGRLADPMELLRAATAYHIADHHARSYVICDRLEARSEQFDPLARMISFLLGRRPRSLRQTTLDLFAAQRNRDDVLARQIALEDGNETAAVIALGERSLAGALSNYIEYLKTGRESLLESALDTTRKVAALAQAARIADLWWWSNALYFLLREFGGSSLWRGLKDFTPPGPATAIIGRYIAAGLSREPAITSLWPSQQAAIPWLTRADRPSFCVRMPTSAGKTRIAEMAILKALLEPQEGAEAKCVYVAPFRSLAVEVERTLRRGLGPLGYRVSEIYGGFDLSKSEERLVEETHVLVATPEKLDAIIRLAPDLIGGVTLFVIDEGHLAGDTSGRGIRTEVLLNRLLNKFPRETCRYLFVSAVLPNPADFARWIGGDPANAVVSDWRPSRLMIGFCRWNGQRVRIDFTHEGAGQFRQPCFVNQFVTQRPCHRVVPGWARRLPLPDNEREAFATAAVRLGRQGTTLVFVPQAQHVESAAGDIRDVLGMEAMLDRAAGLASQWSFTATDPSWEQCRTTVREELGANSDLLSFLAQGIVVHHSDLPSRVRLAFETLIRTGEAPLIIATTTLASGVNLPIRSVLVRGLQQGQTRQVSALDFWNIAGRAGRALFENEGQVLFWVDQTKPDWQVRKKERDINTVISGGRSEILGTLIPALQWLQKKWRAVPGAPDLAQLCLRLAEDDFTWAAEDAARVQGLFALIDQHLLALTSEANLDGQTLDQLQELVRNSLLLSRLGVSAVGQLDANTAVQILQSRVRSIYRRVPEDARRQRFYRLGFSINDCSVVEAASEQLLQRYRSAEAWPLWSETERIGFLTQLGEFALSLETIRSCGSSPPPENLLTTMAGWLAGKSPVTIASETGTNDSGAIAKSLEVFVVYGFSWAANSLSGLMTARADEAGVELPATCGFFSAMFKYGVTEPLAALIAPYVDGNRQLAKIAAQVIPFPVEVVDRAIAWFHEATVEDFLVRGVSQADAESVLRARRGRGTDRLFSGEDGVGGRYRITFADERQLALAIGDRVLVIPSAQRGTRTFSLLTVTGTNLGSFDLQEPVPDWWSQFEQVDAEVDEIEPGADRVSVVVRVRRI